MTQQSAPATIKKPLWRRLLKWTLRSAVVILVLGTVIYAIASYRTAKALNREIARIRTAGEPLTFADLAKLTPAAERERDATPFYNAAGALVVGLYDKPDEEPYSIFFDKKPLPSPLPADLLPWARKALERNATALELLDRGSALPECAGGIQLEYGIAVTMPHLGRIRALLRAGSLRTRMLAIEGRSEPAIDSLISTIGLMRMLNREPILLGTLVQVAMLSFISDDAAFILSYGHPSDAGMQRLADGLHAARVAEPHQMFIAERVYVLETQRNLIANGIDMARPSPDAPLLPERQMIPALGLTGRIMVSKNLAMFARLINASRGGFPATLDAMQDISDHPNSIFDKITAPSFNRAMVTYARALAQQRAAIISTEIERYRLTHNREAPGTLEVLKLPADLLNDPLTGKSLLYVKTADGFCVMSAGRNGVEYGPAIDRDADPIGWSGRWGVHVRIKLVP